MKKSAFTLAELMIVFIIIGIITAIAIPTVQNYDKGIRYVYSSVYHNLDRAMFNAINNSGKKDPFAESELVDGAVEEVTPEDGAKRLCEMLVEYINTAYTSCTDTDLASDDGETFGSIKFQTLNGYNFYISKRLPEEPEDGDHAFFLIYADINGENSPNSMKYVPPTEDNKYTTKDPDVFAFAALDTGRVCPLGVPEFEPRYMQARLAYVSSKDDEIVTRYTSVSIPYYQAKAEAWGYYLDGNTENDDNFIIDEQPTTFNGYIRSKLPEDTKIYEILNGKENIRVPNGVHLQSDPVGQGGYNCIARSAEECWIIVDKYVY